MDNVTSGVYNVSDSPAISEKEYNCTRDADLTPPGFCAPFWDQLICWPATRAGTNATEDCPLDGITIPAYRYCPTDGNWTLEKSNYELCLKHLPPEGGSANVDLHMWEVMRDLIFILSTISLVLLLVTIFVFQYFRSLQCSRITIHKHMVVSFIFRFIINIAMVEPYIFKRKTSYRDLEWLCKTVTAISQYITLANMFWMLVEGFFLHHNLVLGVFSTDPPFKTFYFIGWVLPSLFVIAWSIVLHYFHDAPCWHDYTQLSYYYIIMVPFLFVIVLNLLFLINIIRVLVSKLRANNRLESTNIIKAIKATVVLMPLLGLTNVLFFTTPVDDGGLKTAYHMTNAVLHSSQGIFVAILYCFLNGEVRRVMRQKWYRFKLRHTKHGSGRRRSSRTSSFFLSGTEEDESSERTNHNNPAAEQLRLLQANLALQNEPLKNNVTSSGKYVVTNGTSGESTPVFSKKNNNNGDVHVDFITNVDERETVL